MSEHDTKTQKNVEPSNESGTEEVELEESGEVLVVSEEAAELIAGLRSERDEAVSARQRALADYANFQRRAGENERRAVQRGSGDVVRTLLPVLDHFDLALNQETDQLTVDQLLGGVKIVREELGKALQNHGVGRIEPAVGEEFDPNRHEAMMKQPVDGVPPNCVAAVLQPGYGLGEQVLRSAKVAVTPGEDD